MLEKLEIKEWLELNAKLQQKKNNLRKTLKEKGILKKGKTNDFDNYQYLGELGDLWQNPIIYQDPNGSPLFNVWITTDLKNRIQILHETFIFRFSFIIDVEKYYE